jgi:Kef-type K+ transport system membrane component KefB
MDQTAEILIAVGGILLLGMAADYLGRKTFLPRVTLLLLLGIFVGEPVLGLIPQSLSNRFGLITNIALVMIGFLLGSKLTVDALRAEGRQLISISILAAVGTALIVGLALMLVGLPANIAILLGCISAATAPAATVDTVLESGSKSPFARLLLAIVAIDDAWALFLFSAGLALVTLLNGTQDASASFFIAIKEIFGGMLLGGLIGLPAAYLTGRVKPGRPMVIEALALVLICGGAAIWLEVSYIIAAMTMGAVIANVAQHHEYAFHEIENIEWPVMVFFFVLAGDSLEVGALAEIGLVGIVYLLARIAGKILGAWTGARVSHADKDVQRWMGAALLPQAGVAIGMALLAADRFPEYQPIILPVIIGSTVFFELVGPVFTRMALNRTGHVTTDAD